MGQWSLLFGIDVSASPITWTRVIETSISTYELADSEWDDWARVMVATAAIQRERIRKIALLEILTHRDDLHEREDSDDPTRERFWTIVHDSAAVPP